MIHAADAAVFHTTNSERRTAMTTMLVKETNSAFAVAECDVMTSQQLNVDKVSVGFRNVGAQEKGHPKIGGNLAHYYRTDFAHQPVIFLG
jgi:hypothetical protein